MLRVFALLCFLAQCQASTSFCIKNERTGSGGTIFGGPTCAGSGGESGRINLGDDTGWTGQKIFIQYQGPGKVCMSFRATSRSWGEQSSGDQCSENGKWSEAIYLGDDTGWKDQILAIYHTSNTEVCFRHGRKSKTTGAVVNTEPICSSNGIPHEVGIGDDSGWLDQWMTVSVGRPTAPIPTSPVPGAQLACYCTYFDGLPKVAHCNSCDPQLIQTGVCYTSAAQGTVCTESQRACQCLVGGVPNLAYCSDCGVQEAKSGCSTISQQGSVCGNVKSLSLLKSATNRFKPISTVAINPPLRTFRPISTAAITPASETFKPISTTNFAWPSRSG